MHPSRSLTQATGQQRHWALFMLGAGVLGAHLWLLSAPGVSIWQIQPDPQKLGPLQTRIVPALVSANPAPKEASYKPRPQAQQKPPSPQALVETPTLPPAGITAMASELLPAPVAPMPVPNDLPNDLPKDVPSAVPESALVDSSTPVQPALQAPNILPEQASIAPPTPPLSNALTAKTGDFPPNIQINYKLIGQERGFLYHAYGSLKWQAQAFPVNLNAEANTNTNANTNPNSGPRLYEAELRVRAFLVGSRIWRSTGALTENGLAPLRFSDNWRVERAAHFETAAQKISFSGNMPSAALQAGAQDQVSLLIQMAAAVSAKNFKPGSQLIVQTATARDAVNWTLTFQSTESIDLDGKQIESQRWVCLPRGKFDSQIELWLSPMHSGLPVRIKISQVNGNFIDMEMRNSENLPALPS